MYSTLYYITNPLIPMNISCRKTVRALTYVLSALLHIGCAKKPKEECLKAK